MTEQFEVRCKKCGGGAIVRVHSTKDFLKLNCKWCNNQEIIEPDKINKLVGDLEK